MPPLGPGWDHRSQLVQSLSECQGRAAWAGQPQLCPVGPPSPKPNPLLLRPGSGDGRAQGRGRRDWPFWADPITGATVQVLGSESKSWVENDGRR